MVYLLQEIFHREPLLQRDVEGPAENGQSLFDRAGQTFCDRFAALLYRYNNDLRLSDKRLTQRDDKTPNGRLNR